MEKNIREGENPVLALRFSFHVRYAFIESRSSGFERKMCDKFHIKLNTGARPIANKYREGKMKSSLERELKVPEIAGKEAIGTCLIPRSEAGLALIPLLYPTLFTDGRQGLALDVGPVDLFGEVSISYKEEIPDEKGRSPVDCFIVSPGGFLCDWGVFPNSGHTFEYSNSVMLATTVSTDPS